MLRFDGSVTDCWPSFFLLLDTAVSLLRLISSAKEIESAATAKKWAETRGAERV